MSANQYRYRRVSCKLPLPSGIDMRARRTLDAEADQADLADALLENGARRCKSHIGMCRTVDLDGIKEDSTSFSLVAADLLSAVPGPAPRPFGPDSDSSHAQRVSDSPSALRAAATEVPGLLSRVCIAHPAILLSCNASEAKWRADRHSRL